MTTHTEHDEQPYGDDEEISVEAVQAAAMQQRHLRRILIMFLIVVVLLPLVAIGGAWGFLLLPLLACGALALREAILLRRSVNRFGAAPRR